MAFKGVMIDYGDTLAYADQEANSKYLDEVASLVRKQGCSCDSGDVKTVFSALYRRSSLGEMRDIDEFWSVLLKSFDVLPGKKLIDEFEQLRRKYYFPAVRLYDGALSVLSVLKEKYLLALVSNCAVGTGEIIDYIGLTKFFDQVILSYEVRVRKPDRRIYNEAIRRIGLKAEQCVFVADEISDLEGARNVGMATLLVRQGDNLFVEAEDFDFKPDFECDHIAEIIRFL